MKPLFWRKLDSLLRHKLPLIDSLEIVKKESLEAAEKAFLEKLLSKLRAGKPFSEAVSNQDTITLGILNSGERAGDLSGAISRVAERLEGDSKLKSQIVGASLYPLLILLLCVGLCFILSSVVLPRFEKLFITLGVAKTLPPLTQGLISFGKFINTWGLWVLLGIIATGFGLTVYLRGKRLGILLWKLPIIGGLWQHAERERFFSTLALLLKSGAPLNDALTITAKGLENSPLGSCALLAASRVSEGDRLSALFRNSRYFEESQLQLIALSEVGGNLTESCEHISSLLKDRLQSEIKSSLALLEPVLILGMASVVIILVVALFLPLGPLITRLSSGG